MAATAAAAAASAAPAAACRKIAIFGATGMTGLATLAQAIEAGKLGRAGGRAGTESAGLAVAESSERASANPVHTCALLEKSRARVGGKHWVSFSRTRVHADSERVYALVPCTCTMYHVPFE